MAAFLLPDLVAAPRPLSRTAAAALRTFSGNAAAALRTVLFRLGVCLATSVCAFVLRAARIHGGCMSLCRAAVHYFLGHLRQLQNGRRVASVDRHGHRRHHAVDDVTARPARRAGRLGKTSRLQHEVPRSLAEGTEGLDDERGEGGALLLDDLAVLLLLGPLALLGRLTRALLAVALGRAVDKSPTADA